MHKILGIDLGASAVKAVALEASFRSHEVRGYRAEPVPPPEEGEAPRSYAERALAALQALGRDDWFRADTVVCCLPAAQVATHLVTLPFGDLRRVDQALKFEIEGLIPFDLDEVVFDAHVLSRTPQRTDLLVAVARKEDLEATLSLLESVAVDPAVVTFSALALANLQLIHTPEPVPEGVAPGALPVEALVDIGAERTSVLITRGGQVRFARTMASAGGDVTRSLARALAVAPEVAEELKRSIALGEGGEPGVAAALERAASVLVRDLRATFAGHFARTHEKVERLTLCGGGSRLQGLGPFLQRSLGLAVDALELPAAHAFAAPEEAAPGALALALALRGTAGSRAPKLNFRKGAYASANVQGAWRARLPSLGAMAAVLFVLVCLSTWARLHALGAREQKLDAALCDATTKILGHCETDYLVALGKLKGKGSPAATIPQESAVDLVKAVTVVFPEGGDSVLDDLDVTNDRLTLRGSAKSYQTVDDLVAALERDHCFRKIEKGNLLKGKDERIQFKLDARYDCAPSKKAGS